MQIKKLEDEGGRRIVVVSGIKGPHMLQNIDDGLGLSNSKRYIRKPNQVWQSKKKHPGHVFPLARHKAILHVGLSDTYEYVS
ncbi:uncharacterized protein G2W53_008863 [Senna tora]|uniref:Uncharacterized protein n=1 Tax=Senna tora TaxID=362788 RepID=A0A834WX54_9FABA|nr:uncharacterized protein G2W53_008863 [Senna tora]